MREEILQFQNLKIKVNKKLNIERLFFQLIQGEINGIVFDNNIDKTDFMDFIMGKGEIVEGKVFFEENELKSSELKKIFNQSIAIINKQSALYNSFSVIENIYINTQKALYSYHMNLSKMVKLIEKFDLKLSVGAEVSDLSHNSRICVELLRAYVEKKKVVVINNILDQINQNDFEIILNLIYKLIEEGISFILIELIEEPILRVTDNLYYIKNGRTIGNFVKGSIDLRLLKSVMLLNQEQLNNNSINELNFISEPCFDYKRSIEMKEVCAKGIMDFSFEAYCGELIKIFFLKLSNCNDFIDIFIGNNKLTSGSIFVNGKKFIAKNELKMVSQKVAIINSINKFNYFYPNISVIDNLGLMVSGKAKGIWMKKKYYSSLLEVINKYIGVGIADEKATNLSQELKLRLVYVMWTIYKPKVIFIVNPFSEKDANLRKTIYDMIELLKLNNITVVLLLSNFLTLDKFEGDTIYISDGVQIDEEELLSQLYGKLI